MLNNLNDHLEKKMHFGNEEQREAHTIYPSCCCLFLS